MLLLDIQTIISILIFTKFTQCQWDLNLRLSLLLGSLCNLTIALITCFIFYVFRSNYIICLHLPFLQLWFSSYSPTLYGSNELASQSTSFVDLFVDIYGLLYHLHDLLNEVVPQTLPWRGTFQTFFLKKTLETARSVRTK